jgi:AraC-like DNA-binding protein
MDSAPDDFHPICFTTDALPERDRIGIWRDYFGPSVFRIEIEPVSEIPFHASFVARRLPGLVLTSNVTSPARFSRTPALTDDSSDSIDLFLNSNGGLAWQGQRETTVRGGEAYLMTTAEAGGFASSQEARSHCLHIRVPRADIVSSAPDIDRIMLHPIPDRAVAVRYMRSYVSFALNDPALTNRDVALTAASHVRDLLAVVLGATRDAAFAAEHGGLRAARLQAIKRFVAQNLGQSWLTVGVVAVRHRMTPRSVQRLFETEGTTFSQHVLGQRLELACRMLADPGHAHRSVVAVALDAGFGDLSYFNRCFRRRYGAPPSWFRPAAVGNVVRGRYEEN